MRENTSWNLQVGKKKTGGRRGRRVLGLLTKVAAVAAVVAAGAWAVQSKHMPAGQWFCMPQCPAHDMMPRLSTVSACACYNATTFLQVDSLMRLWRCLGHSRLQDMICALALAAAVNGQAWQCCPNLDVCCPCADTEAGDRCKSAWEDNKRRLPWTHQHGHSEEGVMPLRKGGLPE